MRVLPGALWVGAVVGMVVGGTRNSQAQAALSGFEGSVEKGVYEAEFDALIYPTSMEGNSAVERVEGAIRSRVFRRPPQRTNLEVFRSYQRELAAGGFTTVVSATPGRALQTRIWDMYRASDVPIHGRTYKATADRVSRADIAQIETFADYYLVARRDRGTQTLYVMILISKEQGLYLVDEVTTAPMATGTVTLDLDVMRAAIAETGKVAIHDILFATGSDGIDAASSEVLRTLARLLAEMPGRFYIVGHTDDTGSLEDNLDLSRRRAAAVKAALVANHGIAADRLETRGVGPLAPVARNDDDTGRARNRRVEVVLRLP